MYLTEIQVQNFRGLRKVDVKLHRQITVIIGENGFGKTTILDAIAIMMSHYIARLAKTSSSGKRIADADIRLGAAQCSLSITATEDAHNDDDVAIRWKLIKQGGRERILRPLTSDFRGLSAYVKQIATRQVEGDNFLTGEAPVIYYDQRRALIDIPQRKRGIINHDPASTFAEGLELGGIDFRKLTFWFQERETDELRRQKRRSGYKDKQLDAVRRAMTGATGFSNPYYRIEKPRGLTVTKRNVELHVSQLSTGERSFMALAGDLARRLAVINPDANDPLSCAAIVLIDEIELHLHPRWQRKIIPWLLKTFPACQFIVTTHSPQTLGEVRSDSIRVLSTSTSGKTSVSTPSASLGRDSNYLLVSLLGADERSTAAKRLLDDVDLALANGDIEKAQKAIDVLHEEIEGHSPEVSIAEARLARRQRVSIK